MSKKFNLKIASMLMFDAAHILVHDGIADNELGQCMKKFVRSPTSYAELGAYVKNFTMPKSAPSLDHLSTAASNKNNLNNDSFFLHWF